MKMSVEQLIERSEEIIAQAKGRGLESWGERVDFDMFGLAKQLEACLHTNHKTNQREVLLLIKELHVLSAKMGNPMANK
ncbi:MAG: hypothetical protein ACI8QD_002339 [Cyclobacteriaceae bacterium]|jgi:hypothetical protein